jgi:hypothetical protein
VKRHLAENIYDYLPWIFKYSTDRKIRNFASLLFNWLLCEKACQWLAAGQWFSLGTMVSSTNKPDRHDITEIFLEVALNTITRNPEKRQSMADSSNDHLLPKSEIIHSVYSKCVIVYIVPKGFLYNKVLISDHQFSFILNYLILRFFFSIWIRFCALLWNIDI